MMKKRWLVSPYLKCELPRKQEVYYSLGEALEAYSKHGIRKQRFGNAFVELLEVSEEGKVTKLRDKEIYHRGY